MIDEFGTGTEPQLGGAIAEASLEKINEKGAFGVITTHYANLKLLADSHEAIINGAMLFDTKEIKPLYQLKVGKPGSSFAFEIAKNIGFPKAILKSATEKTGTTQLDFDKQLQQLEVDKQEILKKEEQLKVADEFLQEITKKYEELLAKTEATKDEIISKAKTEAREILDGSNKLIERTIKEIKEAKADKEKTKKLREDIKVKTEEIKAKPKISEPKVKKPSFAKASEGKEDGKIRVGDLAKVVGQDTVGEVVEISGKDVLLSFNSIQFRTQLRKLEKVSRKQARKETRRSSSGYKHIINEINDKMARFDLSIDVRGKRAEEALTKVRNYIDEAILLNVKEVNILHGKGDGILRDVIREYLASVQEIKSYKKPTY